MVDVEKFLFHILHFAFLIGNRTSQLPLQTALPKESTGTAVGCEYGLIPTVAPKARFEIPPYPPFIKGGNSMVSIQNIPLSERGTKGDFLSRLNLCQNN